MMEPREVILKPLITEKGTYQTERYRVYPFQVAGCARKRDIKRAVESIYGVTVTSVRTMNVKGKTRRVRFRMGRRPGWKKALVTLAEDNTIDIF
jgi:large subunit ribosomal protein L23